MIKLTVTIMCRRLFEFAVEKSGPAEFQMSVSDSVGADCSGIKGTIMGRAINPVSETKKYSDESHETA